MSRRSEQMVANIRIVALPTAVEARQRTRDLGVSQDTMREGLAQLQGLHQDASLAHLHGRPLLLGTKTILM